MSKTLISLFKKLGIFLLIPSILLNIYFLINKNLNKNNSTILIRDVIDGDTIVTETGSRIRLLRIDAPELQFCYGVEAKEKLEELVKGKRVTLKDQAGDGFGRVLALVYVGNNLINELLLKEGFARYEGGSSTEKEKLQKAADEAREKQLGIFSQKCRQTKNLENPKCTIKGNIDKSNKDRTYHFPGCSGYETNVIIEKDIGELWFCSEAEAKKAGFTKSKNCYGKVYKQ